MKLIIDLTLAGKGRGFFGSRGPLLSRGEFSGIRLVLPKIAGRWRAHKVPKHVPATTLFPDANCNAPSILVWDNSSTL
jgi:hypothetical protein